MEENKIIDLAEKEYSKVLDFFSRVDSRISVLLSINIGMLALLAANTPPIKSLTWEMVFVAIPVLLLGASLVCVYLALFPRLAGGQQSLIYFREIARKTESKFIEEFKAQSEAAYANDLLSQVWRNSEILKMKFDYLKYSFILSAIALIPWLISLAMFVSKNTNLTTLLAK